MTGTEGWPASSYPVLGGVLLLGCGAAVAALGLGEAYAARLATWGFAVAAGGVALRVLESSPVAGVGAEAARRVPGTGAVRRVAGSSVFGEAALYVGAALFAGGMYAALLDPGAARFLPPLGAGAAALFVLHLAARGR